MLTTSLTALNKTPSLLVILIPTESASLAIIELIISLNFSNKTLISALISFVPVANLENKEEASLECLPALEIPLEYLMHNSQTSSYDN